MNLWILALVNAIRKLFFNFILLILGMEHTELIKMKIIYLDNHHYICGIFVLAHSYIQLTSVFVGSKNESFK